MSYGKGYLVSQVVTPPANDLIKCQMQEVSPLPAPDQTAFVSEILNQGQAGSCTGFGTTAMFEQMFGAIGRKMPLCSPHWFYDIGRLASFAGKDPAKIPALQDTGAQPSLLYSAATKLGIVSWSDYPYPTDESMLNDAAKMAKVVAGKPSPSVAEKAFSMRGMTWGSIKVGPGAVKLIADALQHRCGVALGMFVDSAYEQNSGEVITSIDINDPNGGGHWQAIVAVSGNVVKIRNSWGPNAGKDGYFYVAASVIENPEIVGEIQVVRTIPVAS
jgi:hypothetical protein